VGTVAWTNFGNALSSNNTYAVITVGSGATTHYLKVTNYGFSIADTSIDGITVTIERSKGGFGTMKDSIVKLVIGGSVVGSNKADTSTTYPASDTVATYGGAADLWGLTPSVAEINASDFGVVLASVFVTGSGKGNIADAFVDAIRVTITSSAGASGQPTTKRFGGVQFAGSRAPAKGIQQWTKRVSGLFTPTTGRLIHG
jgi:hypothetical protein